jgi:Ser/Thr protein kinase RdoA (MazF antagonist)
MIRTLEAEVRAHWRDLVPGAPEPRALHFLKFSWDGQADPAHTLVFLVFAEEGNRPVAAAKAARVPEGDALIERELEHLALVQDLVPEPLLRVVPRPVAHGRVNGRSFFLCTSLPGELELHHTWGARRARRTGERMRAALSWSRELGAATRTGEIGLVEWLGVAGPEEILESLATSLCEDDLGRLEPRLRQVCAAAWPAGFAHGDFFPGNLLFEGPRVSGVLDWGHAFRRAPLFVDPLMYELAFLLHAAGPGSTPEAVERQAVHALAPFVEARRALASLGVEARPGGPAWIVLLVAGAVRRHGAWAPRTRLAEMHARILRAELDG